MINLMYHSIFMTRSHLDAQYVNIDTLHCNSRFKNWTFIPRVPHAKMLSHVVDLKTIWPTTSDGNFEFRPYWPFLTTLLTHTEWFNLRIGTVAHLKDPKIMKFWIRMRMYYLTWKHYRYKTLCYHIIHLNFVFLFLLECKHLERNDRKTI